MIFFTLSNFKFGTYALQILCADGTADVNMLNGMGLTPLLFAVKNNGLIIEKADFFVDNKSIIRFLLKHGANPMITVSLFINHFFK